MRNRLAASAGAFALLALASLPASAQEPDQEKMKANLEKKLAEPFLKKAPWLTDYEQALAEAKKSGKFIFTYFTRSYEP